MGFPLFGVGLGCRLLLRFSVTETRLARFSFAETHFARFSFAEIRFAHFSSAETRFARFRLPFRRDSGQYLKAGSQQNSNSKSSLHFSFYAATGGASAICSLLRGRVLGFAVILGAGCYRSESVIQPTDVRARGAAFQSGYGGDTPCSAFEMTAARSGLPSPARGAVAGCFLGFRLPARYSRLKLQ